MLYNSYYSGQNSNLGVRAGLINREEESITLICLLAYLSVEIKVDEH
jgi:hypothetical protein